MRLGPGAILLSLAACATLAATQRPQFRSGVELVHLDVSVLDKDRRPVKGLTEKDFVILEDGRPQSVAAFSAIDLPDPVPPTTPWMRDVAPDVQRNTEIAERRLISIVMDDATIPADSAMIKSAREIARLVVERLGPNDLASVVFTRDNRNAQEFTSDRARLLKAIDAFEYGGRTIGLPKLEGGGGPTGFIYAESVAFFASVGTLTRIAESLADLPQRRKAVVYVTVGVPASAEVAGEIAMIGSGADTESGAIARRVFDMMQTTYRRAQLANVNIYTVSPAGVGGMEQFIQSERWKGKFIPRYELPGNYSDYLVGIAENTGGRAFPERNEFASALNQVFLENGSYYLLGYSPPNPKMDGKYRRVEVKVNRPDLTVRTRSGYYTEKPAEAKKVEEASPLTTALSGLLPKSEIGLEAMAAPFAIPGKSEAGVVVVLTVHREAAPRAARTKELVDVQVSAFTQEGAARGSMRYGTTVTLRPGPGGPIEFEILTGLTLKPGRYQLRMSAFVGAENRSGSVFYDIDIPDFTRSPVSLSGLLLTADPKPISTDTDRIKAYVPIAPTARRTFRATDQVTAFARIYQGGQMLDSSQNRAAAVTRTPGGDTLSPVQVVVSVTDSQGTVRIRRTELVARDLFGAADRTAEFTMPLALKELPPGEYLLTVDASFGRGQARRNIRFKVQ
jgi:VWFA-related protein